MAEYEMKFCGECGTQLPGAAAFCVQCGRPVAASPEKLAPAAKQAEEVLATVQAFIGQAVNDRHDLISKLAALANIFKAGPVFFIVYCVLALPTYMLPYVGSNSAAVNVVMAGAADVGALPAYWWHLFFLSALAALAWIRGGFIGREWLAALTVLAGIFDMTPGLNWIPLAPTGFHVATLIVGVNRPATETPPANRILIACGIAAFMLLLALFKTVTYEDPFARDARLRAEQYQ